MMNAFEVVYMGILLSEIEYDKDVEEAYAENEGRLQCSNAKRYKARHYPRCYAGKGCVACLVKWRNS